MIVKIQKCNASLQWGKDIILWHPFLRILHLFDPISSGLVWIDKLHNFREEICFPNNDCHWLGKRQFLSYHGNGRCKEKNHQKIRLIGSVQGEIKYHNLKNVNFYKKGARV